MAIRIAGMNSGMDTDAMVQDLVKAYKTKGSNYTKQQKRAELKQDAWKSLNKKIKSFTSKYAANMQYTSYYASKKTTVSDNTKASVVSSDGAVTGSQTLEVIDTAKTAYLTGGKIKEGTTKDTTIGSLTGVNSFAPKKVEVNGQSFDITPDMTVGEFVSRLNTAGLKANFDESNGRIFVSSKTSGAAGDFEFSTSSTNANKALVALGLVADPNKSMNPEDPNYDPKYQGPVKIPGSDAKIKLNGAEFTSSNNTFNVNGLNLIIYGIIIRIGADSQLTFRLSLCCYRKSIYVKRVI